MKELDIARTLTLRRKEKGITQEELASYIGVSKASVSKWETGQSYPDILFLPQLATYFDITVDELIGYSPQMSRENIKATYYQLTGSFAKDGFDTALAQCHALIKEYRSCYPLLLQVVTLYLNHAQLAKDPAGTTALLDEAAGLCQRVRSESADIALAQQANFMEAACRILQRRSEDVIALLQGSQHPNVGEDSLLAQAYSLAGEPDRARQTLQVSIYNSLIGLLNSLPALANLYADDLDRVEEVATRTYGLIDTFHLENLYVNCGMVYLSFGQTYAAQGKTEQALDCLQTYARLCGTMEFPLALHGDRFFDLVEPWLEDLDLGTQAPRDSDVIKNSMLQSVTDNPLFASLGDEPRFKMIVANLKEKLS